MGGVNLLFQKAVLSYSVLSHVWGYVFQYHCKGATSED